MGGAIDKRGDSHEQPTHGYTTRIYFILFCEKLRALTRRACNCSGTNLIDGD